MSVKNFLAFVILAGSILLQTSCLRFDESMKVFFPKELSTLQYVQTQFSAFWWNFIIIEPRKDGQADFATADSLCQELTLKIDQELRIMFCGNSVNSAQKILQPWAEDYVLRHKFEKNEEENYLSAIASTAVQASFINDKNLFKILRIDPFQSWQVFVELSNQSLQTHYQKERGVLVDPATSRIVIPLQFKIAPQAATTEPIMAVLKKHPSAFMIGSHGATYRNESQVRQDLKVVSIIGAIVLILFIAFLIRKSRFAILFLTIPVGISIFLAALITQMIDGSIHGLTMAFGSGIIGLALDYGLHGAFGSESKQTWTSNTVGLITTLAGVFILILSGIPLIRQMMIFSSIGLGLGFLSFYVLFKYWGNHFKISNLNFYLPQIKHSKWFVFLIILFGLFAVANSRMSLDLKNLSLMTSREEELNKWFFTKQNQEPFLLMTPKESATAELFTQDKIWADIEKINYEGIGKYLPAEAVQSENLQSWKTSGCDFLNKLPANYKKIFDPFVQSTCFVDKGIDYRKEYTQHLVGESHVLSIFNSNDEAQAEKITARYPLAQSLPQAIKNFSKSLEADLRWMIPASLILTLIILCFYYRKAKPVFTAMIPFLSGLGLYFLVSKLFHVDVDLISILGLVMVFGFSVDYGVFSTDAHIYGHSVSETKSTYTALSFAAITNTLGFLPMLFAGHPVLYKLGVALFFGTIGTYLGTIYGVYPLYGKRND